MNWLQDGSFAPYALPILNKTYSNLSEETKSFVRKQIIDRLASYFSQNSAGIGPLFDFLISIQQDLSEINLHDLITILDRQLNMGANQLHVALQYIPLIESAVKSKEIGTSIFKLATSTTEDSIKQKCKTILKGFNKAVFSDSTIQEINKYFNEQLI